MRASPSDEAELANVVLAAARDKRPFEIVGHGTKRGLGRPVEAAMTIDVAALSGILSYEAEELVITARAGTPVSEIEAALHEKNQHLGFDPADWGPLYGAASRSATIGGVLSADACGPARVRHGAARDHLLGYRAINGLGEAYGAGGRVVKNVTGFDLSKLVCGAMGTLGLLTEVTLRVAPRAPESTTATVANLRPDAGFALLRKVWSSPLEASGLAYLPHAAATAFADLEIGEGAALIRLDGRRVADKLAMLKTIARDLDVLPEATDIFSRIGNGTAFADRGEEVWRAFVPPSAAAACARAWGAPFWIADWAGGVFWIAGGAGIAAAASGMGGYAVLMRADAATRSRANVFPVEEPVRAALTRRVKASFDPLGLCNPGRMYEGV